MAGKPRLFPHPALKEMKLIPLTADFRRQVLFQGLKFGIFALVVNFMLDLAGGGNAFFLGNLALFIAAAGLPFPGLLAALGAALIPFSMAVPGHSSEQIRVLVLCLCISYGGKRFPAVPPYLITLAIWALIFWPLSFSTLNSALTDPLALFNAGLMEVFLTLIAGILLMHPVIWWKLNEQVKPVKLPALLMHICAIFAGGAIIGSVRLADAGSAIAANHSWIFGLAAFSVFTLLVSGYTGWKLGLAFQKEGETVTGGMLGMQHAFSGLASEYWRRQQEHETRHDAEVISSKLEGLSLDPVETGPVEKSLLSLDTGICVLKNDGTISFINRKFRQYTGITLNVVKGKHIDLVGVDPALSRHLLNLLNRTLTSGGEVSEIKLNQLPAQLRFFEICTQRADSIHESSFKGDKDTVVVTLRDITNRRTIETSLLEAQKVESLGGMVKGFAVSFNGSLARIAEETSLALQSGSPDEHKKALETVAQELAGTMRMTHQLVEFASDTPATLETCDLQAVITDRLDLLRKSTGEGAEILFEGSEEKIYATIGKALFMQALTNLICNAKESYPEGRGEIRVSVGTEWIEDEVTRLHPGTIAGHYARVRVQDQGAGMTSEVLEKAFHPLYTTKAASGHTGAGLSTVFAIVRSQDGFLTVESQPGKGTCISIYLPFQSEPPGV